MALPYNEKEHGKPNGLVPLMAGIQKNKGNERPGIDYRELNTYLGTHTVEADACAGRLHEWRQMGFNVLLA